MYKLHSIYCSMSSRKNAEMSLKRWCCLRKQKKRESIPM